MRAQQGQPGVGVFLLAAGREMVAVVAVERGDVAVGVRAVENAVLRIRERGLRPGDGIVLRPVPGANAASRDEERRPHARRTGRVDQRLEARAVAVFRRVQRKIRGTLIEQHAGDGVAALS